MNGKLTIDAAMLELEMSATYACPGVKRLKYRTPAGASYGGSYSRAATPPARLCGWSWARRSRDACLKKSSLVALVATTGIGQKPRPARREATG
jgi:hypothetical protein